jgi:hypothetical protein
VKSIDFFCCSSIRRGGESLENQRRYEKNKEWASNIPRVDFSSFMNLFHNWRGTLIDILLDTGIPLAPEKESETWKKLLRGWILIFK